MKWFKRTEKGIQTDTNKKRNTPHGLWVKSPKGEFVDSDSIELKNNFYITPQDGFHIKIGSAEYFEILFDDNKFEELFDHIVSSDPIEFVDAIPYKDRLKNTQKKTGLKEAIRIGVGDVYGKKLVVAAMDFKFIGGSLGSAMGERIARSISYSITHRIPFMIISKSGGARMQEGAFSLMQLAKVCSQLNLLSEAKIPFISLLTDPTMGGITASFGMLGDINIAEPSATIGFAGRRVIEGMGARDFPEDFQTSEYLMDNGFLDYIIDRKNLKQNISLFLKILFYNQQEENKA